MRRSRVARGHRKQLSASGAADDRRPHQQPCPHRCPAIVVADFCNGHRLNNDDGARQHGFSGFTRQARQQIDVPHRLDRLFCARAVPIVAILLAGRRAAASPMHSTDATVAYRGRTTALPRSFRFGSAPRRVVGALQGVDGHFDLVPPPTPTGSGCLVSLRIGIGAWELAASRAGDENGPSLGAS